MPRREYLWQENDPESQHLRELRERAVDDPEVARILGLVVSADSIVPENVRWLDPGRVPLGGVTILAGMPGLGKSQYALDLAARVTRGELDPDPDGTEAPSQVLILSAEDGSKEVVVPRLLAAGGYPELAKLLRQGVDMWLPADLPDLRAVVLTYGIGLVVIDPVVAYIEHGRSANSDQHVREIMRGLSQLAEEASCTVLAVMHPKKDVKEVHILHQIGGSQGFGAAARSALFMSEDPDDRDSKRFLFHVKSNWGQFAPALHLQIQGAEVDGRGGEKVSTSRVVQLGEVEGLRPEDLVNTRPGPAPEAQSAAEDFLMEYLSDPATPNGPPSAIVEAAKEAGISERTLRRAKASLGVKSIQPAGTTAWEWSLS